jgi:hypothetical protein
MDGVPLAERRDELKSGIAVVDLRSGSVVASVDFQTAVEEVFDVQVIPGQRFPEVLGFQKDTVQHTFVVPPGTPTAATAIQRGGSHAAGNAVLKASATSGSDSRPDPCHIPAGRRNG